MGVTQVACAFTRVCRSDTHSLGLSDAAHTPDTSCHLPLREEGLRDGGLVSVTPEGPSSGRSSSDLTLALPRGAALSRAGRAAQPEPGARRLLQLSAGSAVWRTSSVCHPESSETDPALTLNEEGWFCATGRCSARASTPVCRAGRPRAAQAKHTGSAQCSSRSPSGHVLPPSSEFEPSSVIHRICQRLLLNPQSLRL